MADSVLETADMETVSLAMVREEKVVFPGHRLAKTIRTETVTARVVDLTAVVRAADLTVDQEVLTEDLRVQGADQDLGDLVHREQGADQDLADLVQVLVLSQALEVLL